MRAVSSPASASPSSIGYERTLGIVVAMRSGQPGDDSLYALEGRRMTAGWISCVEDIVATVNDRVGVSGTVEVHSPPDDLIHAVYVDVTPHHKSAAEIRFVVDDGVLTVMIGEAAMAEFRARHDDGCGDAIAHVRRYVDAVVAGGLVEESWWRGETLVRVQITQPDSGARLASWGWPARPRFFFDVRKTRTYEPY